MSYQLPHHPLSEQFVLATAMLHPDRLSWLATALPEPTMFYNGLYRRVYELMREIASNDEVPDIARLTPEFDPASELFDIIATLPGELWLDAKLTNRQLETHASLIKDAFVRREAALALSRGESAGAVLEKLNSFSAKGHDRVFDATQIASLVYAEITERQERVPFPYRLLNMATSGGLRRGELAIVAARQGIGKSSIMQNMALHAIQSGKRVLFVSAEMGSTDLGGRWVTILSRQQVLRFEGMKDKQAAIAAISKIHDWSDRLLVQELVNVAGVEQTLREQEGKIDIVYVDYLQKLSPMNPRSRSEYERVSEVSRTLDNLCQRYNVPMVVAAQFNRKAEGQQPSIADLRDSGQIEADADLVISLWAKPDEPEVGGKAKVLVDILKNRNGFTIHNSSTKEYALWFDKPNFTFYDMEQAMRREVDEVKEVFEGAVEV